LKRKAGTNVDDNIKLHTNSSPLNFSGLSRPLKESVFAFLGVPFDGTVSYKPGCRFGPNSIRELSMNIETQSIRTGIDLEDVGIHDMGDLNVVPGDIMETLRRLEAVIQDVHAAGRIPLIAGGEHTLTLPVIKSLSNVGLLHFDAHGDLRDDYLGEKVCHATVMRRISEVIPPSQILQVGIRALSKEEVGFVKSTGVRQITAQEILESGIEAAIKQVRSWAAHTRRIYISVDLDVFDPAYAPGVGNPEAEGLTPNQVLRMISAIVNKDSAGLDVVELCPPYDQGQTASLAARIFFEYCCLLKKQIGSKQQGLS
jgi:agmatinase